MKLGQLLTTTSLLLAVANSALVGIAAASVQDEVDTIVLGYADDWAAIRSEGEDIAHDAPRPSSAEAALNVDFEMETIEVAFDLPTVYMRTQEIKLDLPQVTMNTKSFSMDVPQTKMEPQKVGEYPCFKGWKWYSCDIVTDVPVFWVDTTTISMDIPEFTWDTTTIKFDLPEFEMHRIEWSFDVPKVKSVSAQVSESKRRSNDLAAKAQALTQQQRGEVNAAVLNELMPQRESVASQFEQGSQLLGDAIARVAAAGLDPRRVPDGNGGFSDLQQTLDALISTRDKTLFELDEQIARLRA